MIKMKKERVCPKGDTFLTIEDYSEHSVVYFETTLETGGECSDRPTFHTCRDRRERRFPAIFLILPRTSPVVR